MRTKKDGTNLIVKKEHTLFHIRRSTKLEIKEEPENTQN